ncbi:MAG: hypothetical protein O2985_16130 [Proteobacteria bacterium]|nr:hypothetical protein [Pseudomonadota bacterium]
MTAIFPVLYLPVEEKGREFDSKLLIAAAAAAEHGLSVVIGEVWGMNRNFKRMPPGVVLFKGVNKVQETNMRNAARHGYLIAAMDEEAMGLSDSRFLVRDVHPSMPKVCDALLAQGPFQASVMIDQADMDRSKIFVTGNPRLDPLRLPLRQSHDAEVARLRQRHGRFVVVNTTSGGVNSAWGNLAEYRKVLQNIGWLDPEKPEDEADYRDHIDHDQRNFEAAKELLEILPVALPDHAIVLRPHPSERSETWIDHCRGIPRTEVVTGTSAAPYILASELLIHTGCTTGVEAAVAGQPALSLMPVGARIHDQYLSNIVNPSADTAAGVVALAREHLYGQTRVAEPLTERMDAYLRIDADRFAFDNCAFVLSELLRKRAGGSFEPFHWTLPSSGLEPVERNPRQRAKMTVSDADLTDRLIAMRKVLGRFYNVSVFKLAESLYVLEARS